VRPPSGAGSAAPELGRGRGEDRVDRVVELTDRGEARCEGDLRDRERRGLEQGARRLGALRAGERERAGAKFGDELSVELASAVAEMGGKAGDALTVDEAIRDEAHRSADEIRATVPLRRAWRSTRAAPLAGPEAHLLCGGGRRKEAHMDPLRSGRGTARSR
jgi:hypothetical protein